MSTQASNLALDPSYEHLNGFSGICARPSGAQENPSCGEDSECMETKKIDTENAFGLEQTSGSPSRMFSSCESRGKQTLTEAEKEAKRLRRVLANRESARKTIFRRQARFEELAKRAAELSLENEKIKMEKVLLMEEYSSLRGTNIRLREQVIWSIREVSGIFLGRHGPIYGFFFCGFFFHRSSSSHW
ncbi:unnamed protein product [Spirodela intermedia]|uniref:BZIP domain-containing protein n=1 Tax=Spirodela intermedia TaxID=51605 RepID=A0A7I8J2U1_SPIIN|nr:unnamed protein product [Spirodela intermedia]CAA6663721.1 unnamed protein product [Spirodela intermedia]